MECGDGVGWEDSFQGQDAVTSTDATAVPQSIKTGAWHPDRQTQFNAVHPPHVSSHPP